MHLISSLHETGTPFYRSVFHHFRLRVTPREAFKEHNDSILTANKACEGFALYTPSGEVITRNDAGYVILPDGRIYIIVAMVTESPADNDANASIAGAPSKAAYEYCLGE